MKPRHVAYSDARTLHEGPHGPICAIHWPDQGGAYKLFAARIIGDHRGEPIVGVIDWTPLAIERRALDPESAVALYLNQEGR